MRQKLISAVAGEILARSARRVAVDGVDGAGKTHFADELAAELTGRGAAVIRASVDGFHQPRELRHRRGRGSPEGYYRDSYDYPRLIGLLLAPLGPGGTRRFVRAVYDVHNEKPVHQSPERAAPGSILVLDGIFTHRDELARHWDYSVWLEVPFETSIPRGAARGYGDPDPEAKFNRRYVEGQRLYLTECDPRSRATAVVDNTDLANPVRVR
ncbi:MAG: uridine kinase [Actinophytocola sp.]|uniref:uridine kinase n=1 Tax=Actinophytocola sp. TaxID=1872138 RepID=UPI0013252E85|nr:uridine kinase [Actinophytocola sp.]MPZ82962.1 uridine kinase [Actinophytocola sp.]